jgi:hypothetical protein
MIVLLKWIPDVSESIRVNNVFFSLQEKNKKAEKVKKDRIRYLKGYFMEADSGTKKIWDCNILKKNERGSVKHRLFPKIYILKMQGLRNQDSVLRHPYSNRSVTEGSGNTRFYLW